MSIQATNIFRTKPGRAAELLATLLLAAVRAQTRVLKLPIVGREGDALARQAIAEAWAASVPARCSTPTCRRPRGSQVTNAGRKVMTRGLSMLSEAFGSRLGRLNHREQSELNTLLEKIS